MNNLSVKLYEYKLFLFIEKLFKTVFPLIII